MMVPIMMKKKSKIGEISVGGQPIQFKPYPTRDYGSNHIDLGEMTSMPESRQVLEPRIYES